MGLRKRTIKLVTKVLNNEKRRKLYTEAELQYMERQVQMMKLQRAIRREQRKREKGFGHDTRNT